MKILQLCNKPPFPPVDGGTLAMHRITEGLLAAGHEVKVLAVSTDKHPFRADAIDEEYRQKTRVESVYIDLKVKPVDAGVALLCGDSYNVKRYESRAMERRIAQLLEEESFDVVQVESIFLTPYVPVIRSRSDASIVLRAHNVEHQIWRQNALQLRPSMKRWYMKKLALALRMYELEHINDFDAVACISPLDADYFKNNGCRRPMAVVPFAVDLQDEVLETEIEKGSVYHLGAMDWIPNVDSVRWLLDEVWPRVAEKSPGAKLYLAGRSMPDELLQRCSTNVIVEGEVVDAHEYMRGKQINIVPLLSGSGIRVKIVEAMSMGQCVVSTTVGANGIDYTDGENILIADTPDEMARQLKRCFDDPTLPRRIGQAGRRLVEQHYSNAVLTQRLVQLYERIIPPVDAIKATTYRYGEQNALNIT